MARDFTGREGAGQTVSFPNVATGASGVTPTGGMDLTSLTNYINNLNLTAQTAANRNRIPRAGALEAKSSANIGNELAGQVSPDVLRLLQQQGAERGVATGTAGSANNNAAYLQALGLTSMGLQEQGQHDLSGALARNPGAPLFDPVTQIMNPYQSASLAQQDRFEQDRVALEQQRLALDAAHAGAGGGGSGANRGGVVPGGGAPGPTEVLGTSTATGSGYTPDQAWQTDPQAAWWNSIGYTPDSGGGVVSGAPAGTVNTATGSSSGSGVDWSSLFSSDLGIDPSLYTPGG